MIQDFFLKQVHVNLTTNQLIYYLTNHIQNYRKHEINTYVHMHKKKNGKCMHQIKRWCERLPQNQKEYTMLKRMGIHLICAIFALTQVKKANYFIFIIQSKFYVD